MTAEIISIGDELLIGQVTNTNASWICSELNKIGVSVSQITAVGDNANDIKKVLKNDFLIRDGPAGSRTNKNEPAEIRNKNRYGSAGI